MSSHRRCQQQVGVAPDAVEELLTVRPATWLRAFLRLATGAGDADHAASNPTPGWYRLGVPVPTGSGGLAASFTWWPHHDASLFTRFKGAFVVHAAARETLLVLEGDADGGTEKRNEVVLRRLLTLISSAISADQPLDG